MNANKIIKEIEYFFPECFFTDEQKTELSILIVNSKTMLKLFRKLQNYFSSENNTLFLNVFEVYGSNLGDLILYYLEKQLRIKEINKPKNRCDIILKERDNTIKKLKKEIRNLKKEIKNLKKK